MAEPFVPAPGGGDGGLEGPLWLYSEVGASLGHLSPVNEWMNEWMNKTTLDGQIEVVEMLV